MKFQSLKVESAETSAVVSLAEAKAQLRVFEDFAEDNAKIAANIEAATAYVEANLWQSLRTQTILAAFSSDGRGFAELFRSPVASVEFVKYFDRDGNFCAIENFTLDASLDVARVYVKEPQDASETMFAPIRVKYTTACPAVIPPPIKQAILICLSQFYDDRDAPTLDAVDNILAPFRTRYQL